MPVLSMSSGSVRTSRPSPPGNSRANVASKAVSTSAYASAKTCCTRASTSRTMSSRSLRVFLRSSSCSVRNRCRSSSAENSSSASGLTVPSIASSRSAVRSRLACSSRTNGVGSGVSLAVLDQPGERAPAGRARSRLTRPVGVEAELLERLLLELLDAHLLLGAGHLVAVHRADQLVVLAGQLAQRRPDGEQLLLATLAGLLDGGARLGGLLERGLEAGQHEPGADQDRLGGPALAGHPLAALELAGPGLALGLGGAQELVGPAVQRAGALLGGAQGQPRLGLGRAGLAGQLDELLAGVELGLGGGVGLGPGQPALELGEPGLVLLAGGLGLLDRPGQPVGLGPRRRAPASRTGRAPRPPRRAWRRTRAAWRARRRPAAARRAARSRAGTCRRRAARTRRRPRRAGRPASSTAAWISSRLGWLAEPPAATWAPSRSPSQRHRGELGVLRDQRGARR